MIVDNLAQEEVKQPIMEIVVEEEIRITETEETIEAEMPAEAVEVEEKVKILAGNHHHFDLICSSISFEKFSKLDGAIFS
jgi:hypothetical protein